MNYRHIYHAGNFADLVKHAVVLALVRAMTSGRGALTVIDTHAGAGLYDLASAPALRTGEAAAGVGVLMATNDPPAPMAALKAAVARANAGGALRVYPGSPALIAAALRKGDRYIGCEARADDAAALQAALGQREDVAVVLGDGWAIARERAPRAPAALLALIDPPYEDPDDAEAAVRLTADLRAHNPGAVVAIWVPIKDLASFDAVVCDLEDATPGAPLLVCETRLRPLTNPMRMNGCALLVVNPPPGLEIAARVASQWVAGACGESGARDNTRLVSG